MELTVSRLVRFSSPSADSKSRFGIYYPLYRIQSSSGNCSLEEMEAKHSTEALRNLQKQNECLTDMYRLMSHELHRLQVEEQMLMRKLYDAMSAEGLLGKEKSKILQPSRENTSGSVESFRKHNL